LRSCTVISAGLSSAKSTWKRTSSPSASAGVLASPRSWPPASRISLIEVSISPSIASLLRKWR
jgi:hypothetical protein